MADRSEFLSSFRDPVLGNSQTNTASNAGNAESTQSRAAAVAANVL